MLGDDSPGGGVHARVGDLIEPLAELHVEVVEVAEAPAEEEVLADVAVWTLHLALGLGPVRPAGFRQVAVVVGERDQSGVVDDMARGRVLAAEHSAHAIVEDLLRHAAERLESGGMAAQQRLQVLMHDEPAPQHAAVAQHEREQPDHVLGLGLVVEGGAKMGKINLRLTPGRRLEADLEAGRLARADVAQQIREDGVAAGVANLPQLAEQAAAGQLRKRREALTQIALERLQLRDTGPPRAVDRRLKAAGDDLAHGLAVEPTLTGNRRDADTLPMQVKDHDNLSQPDHRLPPHPSEGVSTINLPIDRAT